MEHWEEEAIRLVNKYGEATDILELNVVINPKKLRIIFKRIIKLDRNYRKFVS